MNTAANSSVAGGRPLVLVVDDCQLNRHVTMLILNKMGCDAYETCNGQDAIEACRSHPINLVLMDIGMPAMDGYEATRRIRDEEAGTGRRVPIIGFSGFVLDEGCRDASSAGMDDYITKPIDPHQMSLTIHRWLPNRVTIIRDRRD